MSEIQAGETLDHIISLQSPLNAHRFAGQLRENYGIAFRPIAAECCAPVLAPSGRIGIDALSPTKPRH